MTSATVDLASHYSLVDKIDRDFFIDQGYIENLGEMSGYPPGAHYAAAFLNKLTGSGLVSMNIVTIITLALGWIVIAKLLLETGILSLVLMSALIIYFSAHGMAVPFFGMEVNGGNYLYGQFASTGFFIALIYCIYKINVSLNKRMLLSLLGFYLGMHIHASFALCYFAGSFFYFLFLEYKVQFGAKFAWRKYLVIGGYGVVGALLFFTDYYTKFANAIRMHNGSLGFAWFSIGAEDIALFSYLFVAVCVLVPIVSFWLYHSKFNEQRDYGPNLTLINSFLLGFALIAATQIFMLHLNMVSPYVVKKNLFGLFTFFMMLTVIYVNLFVNIFVRSRHWRLKSFPRVPTRAVAPALCFIAPILFSLLALLYWSKSQADLATILKAQKVAKEYHIASQGSPSYRNTIAQFKELNMPMNWLITIGELQVYKWSPLSTVVVHQTPNDLPDTAFVLTDVRENIADDGVLHGKYRVYSSIAWNAPATIVNGKEIQLNSTNPEVKNYLGKGFSAAEPWGTWSAEEDAEMHFLVQKPISSSVEVTLVTTAWLAKGRENFLATVMANGVKFSEMEFNTTNPIKWKFNLPRESVDSSGKIILHFHFTNPATPLSLGMNPGDNRKLAIGVESLKVDYK